MEEKEKKVLKVVIIAVTIISIIVILYLLRNYFIMNKIMKMQEKINTSNNYSYTAEYYQKGILESTWKCYYKDGKMLSTVNFIEENKTFMNWYDKNAKEKMLFINPKELTASIDNYYPDREEMLMERTLLNPILFDSSDISNFVDFIISSKTIRGKECYWVQPIMGVVSNTYFYEKESGIVNLYIIGSITEDNKEYEGTKVIIKDFEFGGVTEEQVNPDLTGYKITDQR